jgi:hypothetical protein
MTYAAAALGYDDEVAFLVDPDKWFAATRLAVPESFNTRLAEELRAQKSASALHSSRATRGAGTWIDRLDIVGGPLAQNLFDRIRATVADYVTARQAFADHPVIAHQPASVDLLSWAVELHQDGHQTRHIHPSGWLSGSYYVSVPDTDAGADEARGWLSLA